MAFILVAAVILFVKVFFNKSLLLAIFVVLYKDCTVFLSNASKF